MHGFYLTNKEALTVFSSVVKQAGSVGGNDLFSLAAS